MAHHCAYLVISSIVAMRMRTVISSRYYVAVNEAMSWPDASAYCRNEYGTSLATVITDSDFTNLALFWTTSGSGNPWIGLNDREEDGWFVWDSETPCFFPTNECSQFWGDDLPDNYGNAEHCTHYLAGPNYFDDGYCSYLAPFVCDKEVESIDCGTLDGWTTVIDGGEINVAIVSECDHQSCIRMTGKGTVYVERTFALIGKERVMIHYNGRTKSSEPSVGTRFAEYLCDGDESKSYKVYFNEGQSSLSVFNGSFDVSSRIDCGTVTFRIGGETASDEDEIYLRVVEIEYVVPPTNTSSSAPLSYHMVWLTFGCGLFIVIVCIVGCILYRTYHPTRNDIDTEDDVEEHKQEEVAKSDDNLSQPGNYEKVAKSDAFSQPGRDDIAIHRPMSLEGGYAAQGPGKDAGEGAVTFV